MKALLVNLLLVGLWVLITADATLLNALVGYAVGFALLAWLWPARVGRRYFRKVPATFAFVGYFLGQLVKSALQVAREIVALHPRRAPGLVVVPLEAHSDIEFTLIMNLVTLTPGTTVVGFCRPRRQMMVHALFAADPQRVRRQIKAGFERRVQELMR